MNNEFRYRLHEHRSNQQRLVNEIRGRGYANVVFIVSSLSMWQLQGLYDLLATNKHYNVHVIYVPFRTFSEQSDAEEWEKCKNYFLSMDIDIVNYGNISNGENCFVNLYSPDVIFYPQFYPGLYPACIDIQSFYDRLICIVPYGYYTIEPKYGHDCEGNHFAWRQYLSCPSQVRYYQSAFPECGDNAYSIGFPRADCYRTSVEKDPWKGQSDSVNGGKRKKRIIWAPHFTIQSSDSFLHRSSFLLVAEIMNEMAEKYKDDVQFVFKPHPRLLTELYKCSEWGKSRADCYYKLWEERTNTQTETGEFVDLFKTSDAMIHDCGSFTAEYLFLNKPVLFLTEDPERLKEQEHMTELGRKAIDAHYTGCSFGKIDEFIRMVVDSSEDRKVEDRKAFLDDFLQPLQYKSAVELMYEDLCISLNIPTLKKDSSSYNPKVSIILPIYNVEKYLPAALDSLVMQTYSNLEIICVDDGSTDCCPNILQEYQNRDRRIKLIRQDNGGTLSARKLGVENATGDYTTFLDPDDWFELSACEQLVNFAKVTQADIVQFGFSIEPEGDCSEEELVNVDKFFNRRVDYIETQERMLKECFLHKSIGYNQCGKFFRSSIVKEAFNNLPDIRCNYAEDMSAGFMLFSSASTYRHLPMSFYHYRVGVGLSTKRTLSLEEYNQTIESFNLLEFIAQYSKEKYGQTVTAPIKKNMRMWVTSACAHLLVERVSEGDDEYWIDILCKTCDTQYLALVFASMARDYYSAVRRNSEQEKSVLQEKEFLIQKVQSLSRRRHKALVAMRLLAYVCACLMIILIYLLLCKG